MRALLQRVKSSSVSVDHSIVGEIQQGLLVFLGVQQGDTENMADALLNKIINYRVFSDSENKMNLSVRDIQGGLLVVSQFTLAASTNKGLRPSFSSAADPIMAENLYDYFLASAKNMAQENSIALASGIFGADMQVSLVNDGPVTFLLEQS